ncbi:MAG: PD40 domain-containing protein [Candidatus Eremiobacteraeota bacterium]|nr:PD40 domain-containing protein [Candidatus Eremiobacteraeota bacterium]
MAALSLYALLAPLTTLAEAQEHPPLLLRDPSISRTSIAFAYAGYIWIAGRDGGSARRLVTGYDRAAGPHFSPDGSMVAFTANYDGNTDVYVVPSSGGEPRRLTYHGSDSAVGWTPDGTRVLFTSLRDSNTDAQHLYTIPLHGIATPTQLPLAAAVNGSYSPDGTHLAYVPNFQWEPFWKVYRGGQTTPIWIANLADSSVVKIPRENSNDSNPMWIGNTVYFVSDRDGPATLFAYDTTTRALTRVLAPSGFDITSASAGPGAIVYAQFDTLRIYDLASRSVRTLEVHIADDLGQVRPHWQKVASQINNASISPTGVRALFEAHGQIFSVPTQNGDTRNVSKAPATANRDPAWSPDGRWIAYFCDASGEYKLCLRDQKALKPARTIDLGPSPSFFYTPTWSPDSKKIAFSDVRLNLWYVDIDGGRPVKVDTAPFADFSPTAFTESWSPDSRWITYQRLLQNHLHAIFVYSLGDARRMQITDGMSDSQFPVFDKSGKYLFFTASTNTGLAADGLDMTSDQRPVSASAYVAVLSREQASPIVAKSDEEPVSEEPAAKPPASPHPAPSASPAATATHIDVDGILQRVLALPIEQANYVGLATGGPGELYLVSQPLTTVTEEPPPLSVAKFDLSARKAAPFLDGISNFAVSFDGKKVLYQRGKSWYVAGTQAPPKPGEGALDTESMETFVDPPREWAQMYDETWRIERDFFYDPNYHGLNLARAKERFSRYLPGIGSRDDLTFLFREMLSYIAVGHMFVGGGAQPPVPPVTVGMLGADYVVDRDRYRFERIYNGENWNPELRAPLTQPGEEVHPGEYLIAVDGEPVHADRSVDSYFQETAGKQVTLTVAADPDGLKARNVTVIPVANEFALRNLAWIEDNRRLVDRLSGGKLGYVYLPDTEYGGFTNFNRYFFSQIDKQGVILDERFNHGGQVADYIIDYLMRKPQAILQPRYGQTSLDPQEGIYGPKVMIINQYSGSGGDAMPWLFKKNKIGPLVGVRTWGGLVGIGGYPDLIDGGFVTAPRIAIGGLNGKWEVENEGIPPDVEVWEDPKLVREGHDPQLEGAVREAMRMLQEHPLPNYQPPPYPNHHPNLPPK